MQKLEDGLLPPRSELASATHGNQSTTGDIGEPFLTEVVQEPAIESTMRKLDGVVEGGWLWL